MAAETSKSSHPSPYRERRKVIVAVAVLALITGVFETATIVTIVAFIEGVTSGDLEWEITAGPIDVAFGRGELVVVAIVALVGSTVGQSLITWIKARAVASWQFTMQMRAISAYVRAGWSTQSSQTSGSLQNLMSLAWGSAQGLLGLMNLLSAGGAVLIMSSAAFVASPVAAGALLVTGVVLMLALRPLRSAAREATRRATMAQLAVSEGVGEIHDLAQEIRVHDAADAVMSGMRRAGRQPPAGAGTGRSPDGDGRGRVPVARALTRAGGGDGGLERDRCRPRAGRSRRSAAPAQPEVWAEHADGVADDREQPSVRRAVERGTR